MIDYNPYTLVPEIGMWVTFCCDHDAERLNTQADVEEFLTCPVDEDGERLYQGSPCKAYKTLEDLISEEDPDANVAERAAEILKTAGETLKEGL